MLQLGQHLLRFHCYLVVLGREQRESNLINNLSILITNIGRHPVEDYPVVHFQTPLMVVRHE